MKRHLLIIVGSIIVLSYFYFNFLNMQKHSVIPIPTEEKGVLRFFLPQGWGFFTRNPREEKFKLYKVLDNNNVRVVNFESTSKENLFGLSRKGNRVNAETFKVLSYISSRDSTKWIQSNDNIGTLKYDVSDFKPISINSNELKNIIYIKPGKYILKKYFITPWNWVKYPENYDPEYKYSLFELVEK